MQESLLHTKLYVPPIRPSLVPRQRLVDQLHQGLQMGRKLTLISAPAGFGKTTLAAGWLAGMAADTVKNLQFRIPNSPFPIHTAWLSLDDGDNDFARFLTYFVAALRMAVPDIGSGVLSTLQSPQSPSVESTMIMLLNEITGTADRFILVLDDYHLIDNKDIDAAIAFLLEHQPANMHLVIATREDPQLPLARLRARNQLTELRVADLRFIPDEAAAFLNQAMGLNLSEENVAALENRTEGWVAGLQMAALSMQGRTDAAEFIRSFTGSHQFVLDYLVEEVLQQQPEEVNAFLLKTSILERMTGSLCDAVRFGKSPGSSSRTAVRAEETAVPSEGSAVRSSGTPTDQENGNQILEYLQRANLFIIPLDDERRWYRYHHLFADLLRRRLSTSSSASKIDELHKRASIWYEENGLDLEAFHHAAAANDIDRAARLVEGEDMPLLYSGATAPVTKWLDALPAVELDARPALWVTYALALTMTGQAIGHVEEKLQAAETALQGIEANEKTRDLTGQIAVIRAMQAIPAYQWKVMTAQARRALDYLHPDNLPMRTAATWVLGLAHQYQGDRAAATEAYGEAMAMSEATGNIMFTLAAATSLGQIQEAENQLCQAAENYHHVRQLAGDPPIPAAAETYLGLARVYYEWNNLDAAEQYGHQGLTLARQLETVDTPAAACALLARLKLARGDMAGAATLLEEANRFMRRHSVTGRMAEVTAVQVRLLLQGGHLQEAASLAEKHEMPLAQARVHMAGNDAAAALATLEPWREQTEAGDLPHEQLKAIVMQAVVYQAAGEKDVALQLLAEALALAEPGGFIRLFIDEGRPMKQLLRQVVTAGIATNYTRQLLAAFIPAEKQQIAASPAKSAIRRPTSDILEPLTRRELEILQLIAQGLSNREISERLFLALNTVKGHNRNIFSKLGVQRRTEAVARARELDLL